MPLSASTDTEAVPQFAGSRRGCLSLAVLAMRRKERRTLAASSPVPMPDTNTILVCRHFSAAFSLLIEGTDHCKKVSQTVDIAG